MSKLIKNWSVSRYQVFNTCERRYYFEYLSKARINSRDSFLKEIGFLKKLTNIPMWKGEIFHSIVAESLQRLKYGDFVLPQNWRSELEDKINQEWNFSESKAFREDRKNIGKEGKIALFEHEYNEEIKQQNPREVSHSIQTWVNQFLDWVEEKKLKQLLQNAKKVWIEPEIYGRNVPGFKIDEIEVIAKVDLALITKDNKFKIFDWKTGNSSLKKSRQFSQAEFQIGVYQLWPHLTLEYSLEVIEANLVGFGSNSVQHEIHHINWEKKEKILSLVRQSIAELKRFHNPESGVEFSLEDFDFASYESACKFCHFKRLCQKELET
ncbi:MAG: PD-(D/E)XK nuclease family protein [Microcoleaceae cyanobacterium MO_207.B10]|nr:PD-(D/E)XK nuclease family protein [Microcoleaceae cyanobacterium MO_207.B10]